MSNPSPPPSRSATPPPIPGSGPIQQQSPLSPMIGPQPQPMAFDTIRLQNIIDGVENISMLDLQHTIGQLAAWNAVEPQFNRTSKDFVNSIHNRMKKEDGDSSEAWTQTNANNVINPYRQSKIIQEELLKKF